MSKITDALSIASAVHAGQVDKIVKLAEVLEGDK